MKYEIVYFDLDHTLLDFEKSEKVALFNTLKHFSITVKEEYIEIYKPINEKWWKLFSNGTYPKEVIIVERFREFFSSIGLDSKFDLNKVSDIYLENLSKLGFFLDGAENLLKILKEKKQRMAAITNGVEKVQKGRSKALNLDKYFEFILTSEKVGKPKPDPLIFYEAAKLSNVSIKNSVYIGDNPDSDYLGSKNVGMDFILYDPYNKHPELDCKKVANYTELLKLII
ncbi:putative hydrolase of the HAD superfamily [Marinitoga hydrogenitolerans DSM 16785]|uniref:Hydrolase of the HAD superfamily n=1 Tax=Marinitoga hydrogenitolerans (strain DSM 16785 / JCM 12826 / AT1271) TaxID=1122195 RepID=A0A1M4WKQ7_MARH1|nr:YjjG family noncanonical pyrimidine nucleotidase [Marinitoga hydrogenitolerans]SHE81849.1 putative hydrolase of the HAD superfamily [Marinitoga hydrogenitolerans DSM 16785]